LEKPSDPASSAGRGAFLIEGYCNRKDKQVFNGTAQPTSKLNEVVLELHLPMLSAHRSLQISQIEVWEL
jgi:hypothetical protein